MTHRLLSNEAHVGLLKLAVLQFKLAFSVSFTAWQDDSHFRYLDSFSWGEHSLTSKQLKLTKPEEEVASELIEHSAIYVLALQIDKAFQDAIPERFTNAEPAVKSAAWIARLIRNTFAHNPLAPHWDIQPDARDKVFQVPNVITLDTHNLDGQPVEHDHYGGPLALLALTNYATDLLTTSN